MRREFNNKITTLYSWYKATHPLFKQYMIEKQNGINIDIAQTKLLMLVENKKSIWIDSFGYCLNQYNKNIVSIERTKTRRLLKNLSNVYFAVNLDNTSSNTYLELAKTVDFEIVVYYKSSIFKYIDLDELTNKLLNLSEIFQRPICVYIDLTFIQYNKIKYPRSYIIDQIQTKLPSAIIEPFYLTDLLINI